MSIFPVTSVAQTKPTLTCTELAKLCKEQVDLATGIIDKQNQIIDAQTAIILQDKKTINDLRTYNNKWYNQPWFWTAVGVLSTTVVISVGK